MYCLSKLKTGKRKGNICGKNNCKIYGHENIFVFLYNLLEEDICLTIYKDLHDCNFNHKRLIQIFKENIKEFDESYKRIIVRDIKYILNKSEESMTRIEQLGYCLIIYFALDTKRMFEIRSDKNFNVISNHKFEEILTSFNTFYIDDLLIYKYYDIFGNTFETNKRFFSIKKNKEYIDMSYRYMFYIKYISPIKDIEKDIAKFLF